MKLEGRRRKEKKTFFLVDSTAVFSSMEKKKPLCKYVVALCVCFFAMLAYLIINIKTPSSNIIITYTTTL